MTKKISEAELVAELADAQGAPASGMLAGVVASLAASQVARVADGSRACWPEAAGAVAQARALASRALALAQRGAVAYGEARQALNAAAEESSGHDVALGRAVATAADAPLELAACAADIAQLAASAATLADAALAADAVVAAKLAAAAADGAAHLVAINLVAGADPARIARARDSADAAARAARSATSV